jgi:thermitase
MSSMHRVVCPVALIAVVCGLAAGPAAASGPQSVIVKFRAGAAPAATAALLGAARQVGTVPALGAAVVRPDGDPSALIAALNRRGLVDYAEPNRPLRIFATPNDPRYRELYALNNTGQTGGTPNADIDAPEGWDAAGLGAFPATGGVKVGIVDTGIRATHEDLVGKLADCAESSSAPLTGAASITEGTCADDYGHGTHVAGLITADANNAKGVTGVAFDSPLAVCKPVGGLLGQGLTSDVANCITYLADKGAKVISMSLGGAGTTTLQNAVRYAAGKDVMMVAAAGNDANASLNYPAAYAEVVSVTATDSSDRRALFSNANSDVEIAAPGVNVLSTFNTSDSAYVALSGTSMATPQVAGVAAIIRTRNPGFTADQARAKLDASVDDRGALGRDPQYGFGRVNVLKAAG